MNVGQLIRVLERFPPELSVYFTPDAAGLIAIAPVDAVINLVHGTRFAIIPDNCSPTIPEGFVDAVVIHPNIVRNQS